MSHSMLEGLGKYKQGQVIQQKKKADNCTPKTILTEMLKATKMITIIWIIYRILLNTILHQSLAFTL